MEPQKPDVKQTQEPGKNAHQSRFQIVKLEERVAPRIGRYHYPGWYKHGNYPPSHTK